MVRLLVAGRSEARCTSPAFSAQVCVGFDCSCNRVGEDFMCLALEQYTNGALATTCSWAFAGAVRTVPWEKYGIHTSCSEPWIFHDRTGLFYQQSAGPKDTQRVVGSVSFSGDPALLEEPGEDELQRYKARSVITTFTNGLIFAAEKLVKSDAAELREYTQKYSETVGSVCDSIRLSHQILNTCNSGFLLE